MPSSCCHALKWPPLPPVPLPPRLLHDDLKESGLLPVLARLMKAWDPKHQPRSYATDLIQV